MSCRCSKCAKKKDKQNTIVHPTRKIVKKDTEVEVVKNIYPTEVINVHKKVIKKKNYYPVVEKDVYEIVVEEFNCGKDKNKCYRIW
ncbi:CotD family spore coat protein [Halobacillus massiliensis]|uniref:CotD family spore coat protein n=1 Tax=Halobacillus massiliensis TaxID=1926286 RepID=UPI0009E30124|nr:CotD family spore coat protein [Halobacillus massiliensis]